MLIVKSIENKTMYSVQGLQLCFFSFLAEVILTSLVSSKLSVHLSTNLSTNFFCTYSFHSLNIHLHHMIYHIPTYNY